jgi:AcrR family transcriptional regulator
MYEMSSDTEKTESEKHAEREAKRAAGEAERAASAEERLRERATRAREKAERAEARIRERSEHAQEKIAEALERAADAEDRAGEKVARAIARAERAGEQSKADAEVDQMVWLRREPSSRRPAHTRADIARAAIEIADSEGFDAVSMRRVAQRLGAGTMTLYHYVRNKGELITLMSDAVMAEVVVPEGELADDWRTALTQIATRSRVAFSTHHWIFEKMDSDGPPGPNGMRHFEQSLQAVAGLDLDKEQTFEVIGQIDDYVFGYSLREVHEAAEHERGWPPEVIDFFKREVATGAYPLVKKFFGDDLDASFELVVEMMAEEGRFERGLARLLDGIEAEFAPE